MESTTWNHKPMRSPPPLYQWGYSYWYDATGSAVSANSESLSDEREVLSKLGKSAQYYIGKTHRT
eukprot:8999-Lingulodinium_polyedra.AAC.1